jgi:hypothetical protein
VIARLVPFLPQIAAVAVALSLGTAGYQYVRAERARTQATAARNDLSQLRREVAEATARQAIDNQREGARRVLVQSEVIHAQVQKTAAADAAADRARTERDRLRNDLAAVVAAATGPHPSAACSCQAAGETVSVLAGLLHRVAAEREELARFADRAWLAGEGCERSYDALTPTTKQETP